MNTKNDIRKRKKITCKTDINTYFRISNPYLEKKPTSNVENIYISSVFCICRTYNILNNPLLAKNLKTKT